MTSSSTASAQRGNLLIIEDSPDHQEIIGYFLRQSFPNAPFTFASSSQEALTHLQHTQDTGQGFPRLVLLDIGLPHMEDGWRLLQQLRTRYKQLPVVVLSAHSNPEDVLRAYQLGAHSFIGKPASADEWSRYMDSLRQYWLQTVTLPASD